MVKIMSQVVRIPANIYSRLERHARGFDTPVNVIERLLNHYEESCYASAEEDDKKGRNAGSHARDTDAGKTKTRQNTVEDWIEHVEIVMGYKDGETNIGTSSWTKKIYDDFCNGEASFGATSTKGIEALLLVIKEHLPHKYNLALAGLRKTIENGRADGKPLVKLAEMYERMGGTPLTEMV
jgi:hypothetical protein